MKKKNCIINSSHLLLITKRKVAEGRIREGTKALLKAL
jgi:hypothetical protein